MNNKIAAIWARVSTKGQAELSLESQIERARAKLDAEGYEVPSDYILSADWCSLDLKDCPQFQELEALVRKKKVSAIAMLERDRLQCKPPQRLAFLADCRDNGVRVIVCQGPPSLEGDEGDLIEFVLAMGKRRSVERARQGSRDGLHDRVVLEGLPTSHHHVYGYDWQKETLVPNENWGDAKLIFTLALQGKIYYEVIQELKQRHVASPQGKEEWCKSTISVILRNPIYAGKYYALKKQAVEPLKRKGNSYGNSSCRNLPFENWHHLPKVTIINPPLSWCEYLTIQERLKRHQELSARNNKFDYLLRGFIFCSYHHGQNGEPRKFHGRPQHRSHCYVCPVGGCPHPYLNGPNLEEIVKENVKFLLELQPEEFYARITNRANKAQLEENCHEELRTLETKRNRNLNSQASLEVRRIAGDYETRDRIEVYKRVNKQLETQSKWIDERTKVIQGQLAQLGREDEALATLSEIRKRVVNGLNELTNKEWRELFTALNLQVHTKDVEHPVSWPAYWDRVPREVERIEISFGLPIGEGRPQIPDIALIKPGVAD